GVQGRPGPYADQPPLMMNAGSSPRGREFAVRLSDMHFDGARSPEASVERIADTKRAAHALGREIQVWTPVGVICRPSQAQADDYLQHCVNEADWGALGHLAALHASDARQRTDEEGVLRRDG